MKKLLSILFAGLFAVASTAALASAKPIPRRSGQERQRLAIGPGVEPGPVERRQGMTALTAGHVEIAFVFAAR